MTDKQNTSKNGNSFSFLEKEKLMKRIERAGKAAASSISVAGAETESAWQTVAKKTDINAKHRPKFRLSGLHFAAAAVLLLIAVGTVYLFSPNKFAAEPGGTRIIHLPDQATVTLNSGSTLTYASFYGWGDRAVALSGEAYFEVIHTGEPFTVITQNARIKVLGTKFNVRTNTAKGSHKTIVYLEEGKVSFAPKNKQKEAVILRPGEFSIISEQHPLPLQPKTVDQSKAMGWLPKKLSFIDQSISTIFKTLEKRYDVKIKVEPNAILSQKLTIYISNPKGIEQTLSDICRAKGLQYRRDDETFTVFQQ